MLRRRWQIELRNWRTTLLLVIMCSFAFWQGWQTTADLTWPPGDEDFYRDIAHAETILDGKFGADPLYRAEGAWYNPLTPALVASVARLTNLPLPLVYARLGAWLNLLAPLMFYLLAAVFLDRWTAVAATFAFLFVTGNWLPAWSAATYSPWLFAANFVQVLFYLTLLVYRQALRTQQRRWFAATGIALGLTFLGHTAPAFIIGGIIGALSLLDFLRSKRTSATAVTRAQIALNVGLVIVCALIVSLPLLASIVGRYRLHTINSAPGSWIYDPLLLNNFGMLVKLIVIDQPLLIGCALLGLVILARQREHNIERAILLWWLLITLLLLGYSYLWQIAERNGVTLPSIVPGFHFVFYLHAGLAVLFGIGLLRLCRFAADLLTRQRLAWSTQAERLTPIGVCLTLAAIFVISLPAYLTREDLTTLRASALDTGAQRDKIAAYDWVRQNTTPDAVFLSSDHLVTFVVGPAGRKVVAANQFFSNPYVDWAARNADRDAMYAALESGSRERYSELAQKYGVAWIIASGSRVPALDVGAAAVLNKVFSDGRVSIYQLRAP